MRRSIASVLFVCLLAGCSDGGPSSAAGPSATDTGSATPGLDNATDDQAVASVLTTPIAWSGHTKEGAWVCSDQEGTGQCQTGQQVAPDGEYVAGFAYGGNLTRLDVNLTWQPAPGQGGLVIAAYGNTSAGRVFLGHVRGPSPLNLRLDAPAFDGIVPDGLLVLMVWPEGKTATQPSLYIDASQQPFEVDGVLESSS